MWDEIKALFLIRFPAYAPIPHVLTTRQALHAYPS
jgi:hypothetical protein